MEIVSLTISLIALSLSGFSFYWVYLRRVKSLLLSPINRIMARNIEFALANNGTEEVVVVSVGWAMRGRDKDSKTWLSQKHKLLDGQTMNLKPGQIFRIESRLNETELKEFAENNGERDLSMKPEGVKLTLVVEIGWIDANDGLLAAEVEYVEYSFGSGVASRPILKAPYDLYRKGKSVGGVM